MKKIVLLIINLNSLLGFSQDTNQEVFIVADFESHQLISDCKVYSKNGEIQKNSLGQFKYDCSSNDSLLIVASGYEYQVVSCIEKKDTFFLKFNQIDLEEVTISGVKKDTKQFYLGSRKKKIDVWSAYGFDFFRNQKLITFFPNGSGKQLRLLEGYIFLDKKDTIQPNLLITFYVNNNGQLGEKIAKNITVYDQNKKRTWFQLNLNNQKIKIPSNGFYISIENYNETPNTLFIGLNEFKEELNIKSYTVVNNIWYELPLSDDPPEERKHFGVKFYFRVK